MSKENDATLNLGVAVLIALAVVCSIGLTSLLVIKWESSDRKAVAEISKERETKLADMETGMAKERASYRVISKEKGTLQLPLDVAMQVTLADLQNKAPQASAVSVNPAPAVAAEEAPAEDAEATAEEAAEGEESVTAAEEANE